MAIRIYGRFAIKTEPYDSSDFWSRTLLVNWIRPRPLCNRAPSTSTFSFDRAKLENRRKIDEVDQFHICNKL